MPSAVGLGILQSSSSYRVCNGAHPSHGSTVHYRILQWKRSITIVGRRLIILNTSREVNSSKWKQPFCWRLYKALDDWSCCLHESTSRYADHLNWFACYNILNLISSSMRTSWREKATSYYQYITELTIYVFCFRTKTSPQHLRGKSTTSTSRLGLTTEFPLTRAVFLASYKTSVTSRSLYLMQAQSLYIAGKRHNWQSLASSRCTQRAGCYY